MKRSLLLWIVLLVQTYSHAQNPTIDSLQNALKKFTADNLELGGKKQSIQDTIRINILNELAGAYMNYDQRSAKLYSEQVLQLSRQLKVPNEISADNKGNGWAVGMIKGMNWLSGINKNSGNFELAFQYNDSALQLAKKTSNKKLLATNLSNRGILFFDQHMYHEANTLFLEALKISEQLHDTLGIAKAYQLRANISAATGEYEKAAEFGIKATQLNLSLNNKKVLCNNYFNIGNSYVNASKVRLALYYLDTAEQYAMEFRNLNVFSNVAMVKGNCYSILGDHEKSIKYLRTGLDAATQLNNPKFISDASLMLVQGLLKAKGKAAIKEATQLLEGVKQFATEFELIPTLRDYYLVQSQIDSMNGNFGRAYENYKSHIVYSDSIDKMARAEDVVKANLEYDFSKKQEKIKLEQQRSELLAQARFDRQRFLMYALVFVLILTIGFSIVLAKRIRENKKANAELKVALNELKRAQAQLVETEKMAAFGVLASRVAHEVLNPLNFVNNFAEIAKGIATEIIETENPTEKKMLTNLLNSNLEKIIHHGERAQGIIDTLQKHVDSGTAHEFFEN